MGRHRRSSVQKYHDRVAGRYDQIYDDPYWNWHDALTWDYLKPFLPRDLSTKVVDLGCGTGKWGAKIARSGFAVTCVDISHQMLDQARRTLETSASGTSAEFVQADLCDLSALPAGEFGLAVAFGEPIGCAASPRKAMKQIRRILRPDGVLVASLDNRLAGIDYYLTSGDSRALARFLRDGRTNWLTRDAEERFPVFMFSPGDARSLVEKSGFELLEILGKTILPMRRYRSMLEKSETRRVLTRIEKTLCRNADAIGRAAHLQIACRVSAK